MSTRVAIVGCGLIGTQWDADGAAQPFSLTHANGFSKNPRARLVALCDADPAKAHAAMARWGADAAFSDPRTMFAATPVDLVVVAASSAARWDVIEPALAAGVKVLVIEKPLATTLAESRRIVEAIEAAGARSVVNFSRHWDPAMRELRKVVTAGGLGAIQRFVGTYGKGITNNGSHMIDLVSFVCDARPFAARSLGSPLPAQESSWSGGKDRALDAQIVFENAAGHRFQLTMLGTDQNDFTCFELRVIGTRGMFEMSRGGRKLRYTPVMADPNYKGYVIPGEPEEVPARAMEAMDMMVAEALELAAGGIETASCDARMALRTAMTVEAINQSENAWGRWIDIAALEQENTTGE